MRTYIAKADKSTLDEASITRHVIGTCLHLQRRELQTYLLLNYGVVCFCNVASHISVAYYHSEDVATYFSRSRDADCIIFVANVILVTKCAKCGRENIYVVLLMVTDSDEQWFICYFANALAAGTEA